MSLRRAISRRHLLIYTFYLLIAFVVTWPVVLSPSSQFMGGSASDAPEMARHIWWFKYALQHGQPLFYQTNLGYPDGISGVTLWANPLQFFPAWLFAFILPLAAAYNITIWLTMALNGWAMFYLLSHLLKPIISPTETLILRPPVNLPALTAGLVFMAFPVFQGHLFDGHAGLMVMWPVPLLVCALFRLMETHERRYFWLSILFFVLSPTGHMLQIIYVLFPLMTLFLLGRLKVGDWDGAWRVFTVALVGGTILLIFLLPVLGETLQTPAYTETGGTIRYSADLLAVVSPSFEHPFFSKFLNFPRVVLGTNIAEGASYIGVVVGFLCLAAIFAKREARWWLALAICTWALSLGPLLKSFDKPIILQIGGYESAVPLPFALVSQLPIFNLARTPGRFNFTLALAVAALAGYGLNALWGNSRDTRTWHAVSLKRIGYAFVLMAIILWEYQLYTTLPANTTPAEIPEAIFQLRERDDVRAVLDLPWDNLLAAKDALYLQTAHEKSLIAGQVSRQTPINPAKLAILQASLDPALLEDAGADVVILHKSRAAGSGQLNELSRRASRVFGPPFYEDDRLALFDVPLATQTTDIARLIAPQSEVTTRQDDYVYGALPGWWDLSGTFLATHRDVVLSVNDTPIHRWTINGPTDILIPLPVAASGYNTISLSVEPPCPENITPVLTCRALVTGNLQLTSITKGAIYQPVQFAKGIELAAAQLPENTQDTLTVRLWWRFSEARDENEIRFVHVLDKNGQRVAQNDMTLGAHPANSEWTERVDLTLGDLPAGLYQVLIGWYTYPDIVRFDVLSDVDGAQNDTVVLGYFEKK